MTQEQIEAKALEEFPVRLPAYAFGYPGSEQDQNEKERAAFIKGCQYAATPSAVSREDKCPGCNGEGMLGFGLLMPYSCNACGGSGRISYPAQTSLRPAESPDAGSCPTCKNEGKVQSTGPTWAYELCPSCKGSRTFQQPMPTTVGIASPDAGSEGLENPYPESVFPTLNEAQIAIAVKALELAGIGADRYAGNIGRLVWDQAAKALTTTANVGDIPAGREGFIRKVMDYLDDGKHGIFKVDTLDDFMRSHWPTPAPVTRETIKQYYEVGSEGYNARIKRAEGFAKKMFTVPYEELSSESKSEYRMLISAYIHAEHSVIDYLQGKAITPADPGSQVEAVDPVKLLEWVDQNYSKSRHSNTLDMYFHNSDYGKTTNNITYLTTADLLDLYKQSLNEKK